MGLCFYKTRPLFLAFSPFSLFYPFFHPFSPFFRFPFSFPFPVPASIFRHCGMLLFNSRFWRAFFVYLKSVDMWSIGVIIYILLGGYPPFHDENQTRLFRKIKAGNFKFHNEYWGSVSSEAKVTIFFFRD